MNKMKCFGSQNLLLMALNTFERNSGYELPKEKNLKTLNISFS